MPSARYLYLAMPGLEIGDVVAPGRWGQFVQGTSTHEWTDLEQGFERARLHFAPHLPSRLHSAFVFEERHAADALGSKRPTDALYEVELVVPDAPMHRANMMLLHPEFMTRTAVSYTHLTLPTKRIV